MLIYCVFLLAVGGCWLPEITYIEQTSPRSMYVDQDGAATRQSQAIYDQRVRRLIFAISTLSAVGFASAARAGEYTQTTFEWKLSIWGLHPHPPGPLLWPILCFNTLNLYRQSRDAFAVYRGGLGGALIALLSLYSSVRPLIEDTDRRIEGKILTQIICAALLLVLNLLIPRRPDLFTADGRAVDAENSACALSRYTLSWCVPALNAALQANSPEQMPGLNFDSRASSQAVLASPKTPYVWRRIFNERCGRVLRQLLFAWLRLALEFGSSFCMMRLLACLDGEKTMSRAAWLWLIGIGVSDVAHAVVHTQTTFGQWSRLMVVVNSQLISSVFEKLLRRKNSKDQTGASNSTVPEINTIVSSHADTLSRFAAIGYIILSISSKAIATIAFLHRLLGWQSTVVAIGATLVIMGIDVIIVKKTGAVRKKSQAARSETVTVVKEALYSLREIKFSSLEAQWEAHIDTFRQKELNTFRQRRVVLAITATWEVVAPLIVASLSVYAFILAGGEATPAVIFPMVSMLPKLQGSLSFLPEMLSIKDKSVDAAEHLDKYLSAPEQEPVLLPSDSGQIILSNATVAWPTDQRATSVTDKSKFGQDIFTLRDLFLNFPVGELSVISGKTGSGKSLLLAAILGEIDLHKGQIVAPSAAEGQPVAFVAQSPWLQDCTIEQNILFGRAMDRKRYEKVIEACALGQDLATLPDGDQTQIGLRGVKLSGGQKARLSFARALFSEAKLMILDDIFSALDTHVSKHIFEALSGELCKDRTRILVTHHVSLCLPSAKYHVHLENNVAAYSGEPRLKDTIAPSTLEGGRVSEDPEENKEEEYGAEVQVLTASAESTKTVKPSSKFLHFYKHYFDAAGGIVFAIAYAVGVIANNALDAWTTYLFGRIKSSGNQDTGDSSTLLTTSETGEEFRESIYWYLLAAVISVVCMAVTSVHRSRGIIRSSNILFRKMTFNVLRMPLIWVDTTSFGEMIKTFTVDSRMVDDFVLSAIATVAGNLFKLTTIICIGLTTSRYIGVVTLGLLAWCVRIGKRYVKARAQLKLGGSHYMGSILEHLTSTSAGLKTIRSFGTQRQFIEAMHRRIDIETSSQRHFWAFHDWVALQLFFVGTMFTMLTGAAFLSSSSAINTSAIGFALVFFGQLHRAIFNVINQFGHLGTYTESVESVVGYTELKTEKLDGCPAAANWPERGSVEAEELEVAYAGDLPSVLKSLSFVAKARSRIGIVGRTGAGKSSLTLALLRLLEPRSGRVLIDGVDISTLQVAELRSRIAFIPQDPTLFSGTIHSNLDYFHKTPIREVKNALRSVGLLAEDGDESSGLFNLDSRVSAGGANLSQGQRQLLCFARILIRNPKIIVLDEATSAVDNNTDSMMQDVIRTHFTGTLIVVAHRLRTIASFDKILVVSNGSIAEQGAPRDLMHAKGAFFELVQKSQDREFLEQAILQPADT
ncbi:hypothetical protein NLG97_g6785 [Lecanicillium saksenae]|uniref:Uncharacterized protein n=1 Tax=Lecanicillium saksenae TaxID=468837 RepID=A0ACC1QNN2_9HYPO|nr:hypothetical protein NLG97_g6785 [Lecanicillium saksenae]